MVGQRGRTGHRGSRGIHGDRGERGDNGYFDTSEVMDMLERIEDKTDGSIQIQNSHTTELAVIKQQVIATNGTVKKNCQDIDQLYKLSNDDDKKWAALFASLNTWKYLAVLLGLIATVISIFTFFVKQ